ncbi:MAG: hypothetical protein ABSE89_09940 [Sedimentisphaerales bacterium]
MKNGLETKVLIIVFLCMLVLLTSCKEKTEKEKYTPSPKPSISTENMEFRPIAIRASSQMDNHYTADTILETSSAIWHSGVNPIYPQWLEFEYESPVVINHISILCQIGAPKRAPSDFYFQGQIKDSKWLNLLDVNNAAFKDGDELKSWPIENTRAFKCYRLYITENNGANDLLTIQQIGFGYADNKKK